MTPIERVQRRAEAARKLDVSIYSPSNVLKAKWRKRAFEAHPDRDGGSAHEFKELQLAYEILAGTAPDHVQLEGDAPTAANVRPRRVSRTPSRIERPVY